MQHLLGTIHLLLHQDACLLINIAPNIHVSSGMDTELVKRISSAQDWLLC